MDQLSLESALADLNLPAIRFFSSIDSTNNEAWRWVDAGAPHSALVIADEQTAGRGRNKRRWITTAGSGLAFSLVLQSPPLGPENFQRLTGLAAIATCNALRAKFALPAQIKWPNDILLNQRKLAGILVESRWEDEILNAAIIGIGINIAPESVNPVNLSTEGLNFPATCVEDALGHSVERMEVLSAILQEFFSWLPQLSSQDLISCWDANLAFHDEWVDLFIGNTAQSSPREAASRSIQVGKLIGLTPDGSLKLLTRSGKMLTTQVGEIHLRHSPAD